MHMLMMFVVDVPATRQAMPIAVRRLKFS